MLCLLLLVSVRPYSRLPLGIGPVYYIGGFTLTVLGFYSFCKTKCTHSLTYLAPILYIIWALAEIFRGQFEITSGWVFNQYLHGILSVLVPVCIFLFVIPDTIIRSFQILNIFTVLYSFISFGWNYNLEAPCFAFTPFYYFYLCFITKIPKNWCIITLIAIALVLAAYTDRSAFAKVLMSLGVFLIFLLPTLIQKFTLNIAHLLLYFIPVVLLFLGLTGQYNIFQGGYLGNNEVKIVVGSHGVERQTQERRVDTRTFLYKEVLASIATNNNLLIGNTPARGYYSSYFAATEGYIPGKVHGERIASEVGLLNTMLWLGVIGLVLLTFVYIQGTSLALYRSKNKYVKCLAVAVAFQWLWSWIENRNQFHMLDLIIYVMLAICYSPYFREMTNLEFEMWFRSIFQWPTESLHDYNKYQIIRAGLTEKIQDKLKK